MKTLHLSSALIERSSFCSWRNAWILRPASTISKIKQYQQGNTYIIGPSTLITVCINHAAFDGLLGWDFFFFAHNLTLIWFYSCVIALKHKETALLPWNNLITQSCQENGQNLPFHYVFFIWLCRGWDPGNVWRWHPGVSVSRPSFDSQKPRPRERDSDEEIHLLSRACVFLSAFLSYLWCILKAGPIFLLFAWRRRLFW